MSSTIINPPPSQPDPNHVIQSTPTKPPPEEEKQTINPEALDKIRSGMPVSAEELTLSDDAAPENTRENRPTTVSLGLGIPEGIHITVNHNLNDKFAIGGSVGTMGVINDYSVHGRYYFATSESGKISGYTQTGAHVLKNNTGVGDPFGIAISQTVGVEYRAEGGVTYNVGAGAAVDNYGQWLPAVQATIGYSFGKQ